VRSLPPEGYDQHDRDSVAAIKRLQASNYLTTGQQIAHVPKPYSLLRPIDAPLSTNTKKRKPDLVPPPRRDSYRPSLSLPPAASLLKNFSTTIGGPIANIFSDYRHCPSTTEYFFIFQESNVAPWYSLLLPPAMQSSVPTYPLSAWHSTRRFAQSCLVFPSLSASPIVKSSRE
jgi:hypothetical protein